MSRHLLVIGAQRCGTTYLHDLLAAHPDVAMARPARPEPKVFLADELAGRGKDWYERTYFAHAGNALVLGEKSTSYLEYAEAADRARRVLGDPLILVQLRDPVRRAISHWAFSSDSGLEQRPLDEVLAANLEGPLAWDATVTSVSPFAYLERGRYADALRPWLDVFGPDMEVLFLEEMVADPGRVEGLDRWLGVDPAARPPVVREPVNRSRRAAPELDGALLAAVRDYFHDSDRALAELVGRDLPWTRVESERSSSL